MLEDGVARRTIERQHEGGQGDRGVLDRGRTTVSESGHRTMMTNHLPMTLACSIVRAACGLVSREPRRRGVYWYGDCATQCSSSRALTPYERSANVPSVRIPGGKALAIAAALAIGFAASLASPAAAQYFGRNKVQYETFHFRRLKPPHSAINTYPANSLAAVDAPPMAEPWSDQTGEAPGRKEG